MIKQAVYAKLSELSKELHDCGWSVARCKSFSAEMLNRMVAIDRGAAEYDRQAMQAARLRPYGLPAIAERQHCDRSTAHRRAKRGEKLLREESLSATR